MPFGALNVASAAATPRHSAKMERLSALATPKQQKSPPNVADGSERGEAEKAEPVQLFRGMSRRRTPTAARQPFSLFDATTV